jgi:hypothetical protein
MCLTLSPLANLHRWNWDGDRIVHRCIVPSSRPVVGRTGKRNEYDIDVREFLVTERNEVMRKVIREAVPQFAADHGIAPEQLDARTEGAFDRRAAVVSAYVASAIHYTAKRGDWWQFPDETLFIGSGDCEDRALLIASLLVASGISNFNVRVAIGKLHTTDEAGRVERHDHAWVMYKTEAGRWTVLEPHSRQAAGKRPGKARRARVPVAAEYVPYYLFNDAHLWEVVQPGSKKSFQEMALSRRWRRIDPEFAGEIHRSIVSDALAGLPRCPPWLREGLTRHFTSYFGAVVDEPDNFVTNGYDCYDHFDNAFIAEGWARVSERIASFKLDPQRNLDAFAWAAHGIADFYAHSSYGEFGPRRGGKLVPYAATPGGILYGAGVYALSRFSVSGAFKGDATKRTAIWGGKLITGRYCQHGDSRSLLERICPTPEYLDRPGIRMLLPHHDEIAVDGPTPSGAHILYQGDPARYAEQFELRRGAATEHIRSALQDALGGAMPVEPLRPTG